MKTEYLATQGVRVVDLSRTIDPKMAKRTCKVTRFLMKDTRDFHSDLTVESHLGTHIESPYHFREGWPDIGSLPASAFMGRAVLLHVDTDPREDISHDLLTDSSGDKLRPDDIVVLDSNYHCEPFSNDPSDKRPRLCAESAQWFMDQGVKCVAFGDGISIEHDVEESCKVHEILMRWNILLLECLANLDQLHADVFFMIYLPMPIKGLDSCCVRAVAIEGLPGFS